jgi:hypothetical protein
METPSSTFMPPAGYPRIKVVGSFAELVGTPFGGGVNALCWARPLAGDFGEIVARLEAGDARSAVDEAGLRAMTLSDAGALAREILLEDLQRLRARGLEPNLDCIARYPRDTHGGPVPTDVYSFHADSAPIAADTYLCSYFGPASEGLRNDEAVRRVDVPATRAALLKEYGGQDDEDFRRYLNGQCFDLHYAGTAGARPFSFGPGNLWRIATEYPGSPVPPCIHRAPETTPGQPPRLLLIS